jgi:hypothetical protein
LAASPARSIHPTNAHPAERLAALIDEHISRFGLLLALQSLEASNLIPF